jgi:DNA-nicking Smr family endonuclease
MTKRPERDEASDADAFARAMAEENVVPLSKDSDGRVRTKTPVSLPPIENPAARNAASDAELDSAADFAADGVDRRALMKLKRGQYAAADRCDLHGMTADAASATVKQFLDTSRRARHQCICIVHGRGLRSPGGVSVLRSRVRAQLRSHPAVLAYADAPRTDGGAGAVYILLRRR